MRAAIGYTLYGLFAIAAIGLVGWHLRPLDHLAIALALTLLCADQGRMALADLSNIAKVSQQLENGQATARFSVITWITIVLELLGFYLAWLQLGLGTALVLSSQLFFNTAATVQLYPGCPEPVQAFGLQERYPVLIANTVALGLVAIWQAGYLRPIMAGLSLAMVLTYLAIKYSASKPSVKPQ